MTSKTLQIPYFTSPSGKKGIAFDSLLNRFVFDQFVNKRIKNQKDIIGNFKEFKKTLDNTQFSFYYWSDPRCSERLVSYINSYQLNEKNRSNGFLSHDSMLKTIMYRFKQNNGLEAFLPQKNIASVTGFDQTTVSRYIRDAIKDGYIIRLSLGNNLIKKASTYRLTQKGIEFIEKIWGGFSRFMQKVEKVVQEVRRFDPKALIASLLKKTSYNIKTLSEDKEFQMRLKRRELYGGSNDEEIFRRNTRIA